jgi:hypothetical protein
MDSDHTFTHKFWSYINTWILIMQWYMKSDHTLIHEFWLYIDTWNLIIHLPMNSDHTLIHEFWLYINTWVLIVHEYMNSNCTLIHEFWLYIPTSSTHHTVTDLEVWYYEHISSWSVLFSVLRTSYSITEMIVSCLLTT